MRRQVTLALVASAITAPIPVALAQTGSDIDTLVGVPTLDQQRELRREARAAKQRVTEKRQKRQAAAAPVIPAHLAAIAACESGGDPTAVSADGTYRGLFQFDYGTWASVGGAGDPAAASVAEQVKRAKILYARSGSSPWPVCG